MAFNSHSINHVAHEQERQSDRMLSRRQILASSLALLGSVASGCVSRRTQRHRLAQSGEAPRPNIIHVLADDLGYGETGFNGQRRIQTPNMDRLAAEGIVFSNHYAGAPTCTPSRYVLMTGRHTGRIESHDSGSVLGQSEPTVAELLKRAGYSTHFVGKWGLGGADMADDPHMDETGWWPSGTGHIIEAQRPIIPSRKGFDTSLAYLSQRYAHWHYPQYLWRNGVRKAIPANSSPDYAQRGSYAHDLFEDEVVRCIHAADGHRPFYIQASFTLPHREVHAPPGPNPYTEENWPEPEKAYAAMVTRLDATVGRILDAVDASPQCRTNTLVVLSSDNGPHGKDGHSPCFFDSAGGLRGMKFDLYEGGIRVPTAMRWTGTIRPGATTDMLSGFQDFLPTCAELAGVPVDARVDGVSLAPLLTGRGNQKAHQFLYWENGAAAPSAELEQTRIVQAVRRGSWKLAVRGGGSVELYDLAKDRAETKNRASDYPEVVDSMRSIAASQASVRSRN